MTTLVEQVVEFRGLHASGCFVMPNPWDAGSARALASMGFRALATTSAGFAWSTGRPDNTVGLQETLAHLRLIAGADAGADCLYAPFMTSLDHVSAVVTAVAPKPVNLLIHTPYTTVAEAAALGVRRISIGGMLAKTAWRGFLEAAREIAEHGTFSHFADLPDLNGMLSR